jgi:hypothetical protein
LDLSSDVFLQKVLQSVSLRLGTTLDLPVRDAAATVIAESNARLLADSPINGRPRLEEFARIEKVTQGTITNQLGELVRGTVSPEQFVADNTGAALRQQFDDASIGNVVPIRVSVGDQVARFDEAADQLEFTISLSQPSAFPVSVNYASEDDSAVAGVDYQSASGQLQFAVGQTSATVVVPIQFDSSNTSLRSFRLRLSDPQAAVFSDSLARGYVIGGDDRDSVSVFLEAAAPNKGDGNADGIADATQSNVVTVAIGFGGNYLSFAADESVTLDEFSQQVAVRDLESIPTRVDALLGEFAFRVPAVQGAAQVVVDLSTSENPRNAPVGINSWYSRSSDAVAKWNEFLFDGDQGAEIIDTQQDGSPDQFILHLIDGGRGDTDGVVDGVITFVGTPVLDPNLFDDAADSDNDGVSDAVEDGAPGGDGNDDGIADRLQGNVASLPASTSSQYVTLVSPTSRPFASVSNEVPSASNSVLPQNILFPVGLLSFEITQANVDDPVDVQWILHGGSELTTLYYDAEENPGSPFAPFSADDDTDTGIRAIQKGYVITRHVDGSRGESPTILNSVIRFAGGPGLAVGVPAQNPVTRTDVNNDGRTSAIDALRVINILGRRFNTGSGFVFPADSSTFLDVSGDGNVSALDALQVINKMARDVLGGTTGGEGESAPTELARIDHPSLPSSARPAASRSTPTRHLTSVEQPIQATAADAAHRSAMSFGSSARDIEIHALTTVRETNEIETSVDQLLSSVSFFDEIAGD